MWEWANDPTVRASSFSSEPIPFHVHRRWYSAKLASPDARIWVMEMEGTPVGQIRCERTDAETVRLSYLVAAGHRGGGLGTRMLDLVRPLAGRELGIARLEGVAFADNEASLRAFRKAGYTEKCRLVIQGRACVVFGADA